MIIRHSCTRAALLLPFALLVGCHSAVPPASDAVRPVKTFLVTAGDEIHVRTFPGKAEALRRAELAFQVSGVLVQFPVKEGQRVARGELIGQLRKDEFEARLKTLQGQLDQARAQLRAMESGDRPEQQRRLEADLRAARARFENARVEADRNARLLRNNAIARSEFDLSETALRVAREEYEATRQAMEKGTVGREEDIDAAAAQVRAIEGRVVEAKLQLDDCTLRAPFDGVIAQRFVEENQNVRAKEPVVQFKDLDEIVVGVDVPEALMSADLRTADIVRMVVEFGGSPGLQFPVRVREVAQAADPVTQTFRVRAALEAPPDIRVLPGMTAVGTIHYRRSAILDNRILIPITAVYKEPSGEQVVWVLGPEQSIERRVVKLGEARGGRVEILQGLEPGNRIAVAGVSFLREGMKVRDLGDALGGG